MEWFDFFEKLTQMIFVFLKVLEICVSKICVKSGINWISLLKDSNKNEDTLIKDKKIA